MANETMTTIPCHAIPQRRFSAEEIRRQPEYRAIVMATRMETAASKTDNRPNKTTRRDNVYTYSYSNNNNNNSSNNNNNKNMSYIIDRSRKYNNNINNCSKTNYDSSSGMYVSMDDPMINARNGDNNKSSNSKSKSSDLFTHTDRPKSSNSIQSRRLRTTNNTPRTGSETCNNYRGTQGGHPFLSVKAVGLHHRRPGTVVSVGGSDKKTERREVIMKGDNSRFEDDNNTIMNVEVEESTYSRLGNGNVEEKRNGVVGGSSSSYGGMGGGCVIIKEDGDMGIANSNKKKLVVDPKPSVEGLKSRKDDTDSIINIHKTESRLICHKIAWKGNVLTVKGKGRESMTNRIASRCSDKDDDYYGEDGGSGVRSDYSFDQPNRSDLDDAVPILGRQGSVFIPGQSDEEVPEIADTVKTGEASDCYKYDMGETFKKNFRGNKEKKQKLCDQKMCAKDGIVVSDVSDSVSHNRVKWSSHDNFETETDDDDDDRKQDMTFPTQTKDNEDCVPLERCRDVNHYDDDDRVVNVVAYAGLVVKTPEENCGDGQDGNYDNGFRHRYQDLDVCDRHQEGVPFYQVDNNDTNAENYHSSKSDTSREDNKGKNTHHHNHHNMENDFTRKIAQDKPPKSQNENFKHPIVSSQTQTRKDDEEIIIIKPSSKNIIPLSTQQDCTPTTATTTTTATATTTITSSSEKIKQDPLEVEANYKKTTTGGFQFQTQDKRVVNAIHFEKNITDINNDEDDNDDNDDDKAAGESMLLSRQHSSAPSATHHHHGYDAKLEKSGIYLRSQSRTFTRASQYMQGPKTSLRQLNVHYSQTNACHNDRIIFTHLIKNAHVRNAVMAENVFSLERRLYNRRQDKTRSTTFYDRFTTTSSPSPESHSHHTGQQQQQQRLLQGQGRQKPRPMSSPLLRGHDQGQGAVAGSKGQGQSHGVVVMGSRSKSKSKAASSSSSPAFSRTVAARKKERRERILRKEEFLEFGYVPRASTLETPGPEEIEDMLMSCRYLRVQPSKQPWLYEDDDDDGDDDEEEEDED